MTAVAAPPSDTLVSQPAREVTYLSARDELRLVHTPTYPIYASNGRKLGEERGITVEFRDKMLRVPLEGQVVTANRMKIDAADLNAWLLDHPLFGDGSEGFTKIAQVAPPVSDAEQDAITQAATMHQVDTLQEILDAERAGWKRPGIIKSIERSLETIERVTEEYRQQFEAEEAKPAAKKAPGK
jgi:hypothetical protein